MTDLIRKFKLWKGCKSIAFLGALAVLLIFIYRLKTQCPACINLETLVWDHYTGPFGEGDPLWMSAASLKHLGWHEMKYISLTNETLSDIVMVTAASSEHFSESLDLIGSIHMYYPQQKFFYYDLGLTYSQRNELQSLCNVTYKPFLFHNYPRHVRDLGNFAWKALIIQELLHSYNGVIWLDSSIRWKKPWLYIFQNVALQNGGIALLIETHHSVFAAVHEDLYKYFPSNKEKLKEVAMFGAGAIVLYRTQQMYTHILQWWVACSLVSECIAPTDEHVCDFKAGRWDEFANCHRYDQSIINVLAANHFQFMTKKYTPFGTNALKVQHQLTNEYIPNNCH